MILRPYQRTAVDSVYGHLRTRDDNPCVVIPTAGGKTPIIATICQDAVSLWRGRVLVLAHVRELLEQTALKLQEICPEVFVGLYSASLKRRETLASVVVAGIQSAFRQASELGYFDLVLIDEGHMLPAEGEGMYRRLLADLRATNPLVRIVGFTATPYRLDSGLLCGPDNILNTICFEVGIKELIRDGYLCPPVSKAGVRKPNVEVISIRAGEFVAAEAEAVMDEDWLVESACAEIIACTHNRRACLIFACGVRHGQHVVREFQRHGIACGFINGDTPPDERDRQIAAFRSGQLKYLCNVRVLTTGFDAPNIDCVAILVPTMSPGLLVQMVGRGFRLHPDKVDFLILDFGGNILRHGPIDQITAASITRAGSGPAPAKECPECHELIAAGYARCPSCGFEFPRERPLGHDELASTAGVLSGQISTTRYTVDDVFYCIHRKRKASDEAPRSMKVNYRIGWHTYKTEWVCFEHKGYARERAEEWWQRRSSLPVPDTAAEAVCIAQDGGVAEPLSITVRAVAGERYERIIDHELEPLPNVVMVGDTTIIDDTEVPF